MGDCLLRATFVRRPAAEIGGRDSKAEVRRRGPEAETDRRLAELAALRGHGCQIFCRCNIPKWEKYIPNVYVNMLYVGESVKTFFKMLTYFT
jgi:hypothetical protein